MEALPSNPINGSMMIQSAPLRLAGMASGWIGFILGLNYFSKKSPGLNHWLVNQPRLGQMIQKWEQHGSISQSAKRTATVLIHAHYLLRHLDEFGNGATDARKDLVRLG